MQTRPKWYANIVEREVCIRVACHFKLFFYSSAQEAESAVCRSVWLQYMDRRMFKAWISSIRQIAFDLTTLFFSNCKLNKTRLTTSFSMYRASASWVMSSEVGFWLAMNAFSSASRIGVSIEVRFFRRLPMYSEWRPVLEGEKRIGVQLLDWVPAI